MDSDIKSILSARELLERASNAQKSLASFSQEKVNSLVKEIARSCEENAEKLARLAHKETGFGVYQDKVSKNIFASKNVYEYIKDIKTAGVIKHDKKRKIIEFAEPMGIIVSIVPSTNPTSTTIYNSLIALKARNGIVFSPHPSALNCTLETIGIIKEASTRSGAPDGIVSCLETPHIKGTEELMSHHLTSLILATGGTAMVKAAHSAGKPAIGVGPGNVPAFIERTANIKHAVNCIVKSKTFDNGMICSSEQAIVVDKPIEMEVINQLERSGCLLLNKDEVDKVSKTLFHPDGSLNQKMVGQSAYQVASEAGFSVDKNTTLLVAPIEGIGPDYPLSREKLSPVVTFFVEDGWRNACQRCKEIVEFLGLGHTLIIHSTDPEIIMQYGYEKPVFRVLVNSPGSQGAIGLETHLPPALTLGCGTWGGSITSDNITPEHLINIKRVAFNVKDETISDDINIENLIKTDTLSTGNSDTTDINREIVERIVREILEKKGIF